MDLTFYLEIGLICEHKCINERKFSFTLGQWSTPHYDFFFYAIWLNSFAVTCISATWSHRMLLEFYKWPGVFIIKMIVKKNEGKCLIFQLKTLASLPNRFNCFATSNSSGYMQFHYQMQLSHLFLPMKQINHDLTTS